MLPFPATALGVISAFSALRWAQDADSQRGINTRLSPVAAPWEPEEGRKEENRDRLAASQADKTARRLGVGTHLLK